MSENTTRNALICRRARDLLMMNGWPEHTDVVQLSSIWPCWLGVCVRLDATDLVALIPRLCPHLDMPTLRRHAVDSAIQKLTGTKAEMVLYQRYNVMPPAVPGGNTEINFPFAFEWLDEQEIEAILDVITLSVRKICMHMLVDGKCIQAALQPSQEPRLFARKTRHFRMIAEESDEENWLDESDHAELSRILEAILTQGARFGAVRVIVINDTLESITAYNFMTDVLRFPDDPPRRWFDRDVLSEVCNAARQEVRSIMGSYRAFANKR